MKQSGLTSKIMRRIVDIEKVRIRRAIMIFGSSFVICLGGFLSIAFVVRATLERQQTLSVFSLLSEDPEIVRDFMIEVLDTVWEELPKTEVLTGSIFLALIVALVYLFGKRYPKLEKKRKSLYAYATKKKLLWEMQHKIHKKSTI